MSNGDRQSRVIGQEVFDKRFLVTGATGFIGACLTRRLVTKKAEVHITARPQSNLWRIRGVLPHLHKHHLDLRNREAVTKLLTTIRPQVIYHCAAYGVYSSQDDTQTMLETNVLGTANLVEVAADIGCECIVNSGTAAEYGPKNATVSEISLPEPTTMYGVSKAAATLLCQAIARTRQQTVVTARMFYIYGYYETPTRLIPYVIDCCLRNEPPKLSGGWQTRDFVFIDDVIDLYLKIAASPPPSSEIVNVASGRQHTIRELVSTIISLTEANVEPHWGAITPSRFDTIEWQADPGQAQQLFGWRAKTDLIEGLRLSIEWQQHHSRA